MKVLVGIELSTALDAKDWAENNCAVQRDQLLRLTGCVDHIADLFEDTDRIVKLGSHASLKPGHRCGSPSADTSYIRAFNRQCYGGKPSHKEDNDRRAAPRTAHVRAATCLVPSTRIAILACYCTSVPAWTIPICNVVTCYYFSRP